VPRLPSPTVHFETRMAAVGREDAGLVPGRQALQGPRRDAAGMTEAFADDRPACTVAAALGRQTPQA
jgi:hypothetical protein